VEFVTKIKVSKQLVATAPINDHGALLK